MTHHALLEQLSDWPISLYTPDFPTKQELLAYLDRMKGRGLVEGVVHSSSKEDKAGYEHGDTPMIGSHVVYTTRKFGPYSITYLVRRDGVELFEDEVA